MSPPPGPGAWPRLRRHALRALTWAFFAGVAAFTVRYALTVDWPAVGRALAATPGHVLLQATALAGASHAVYSGFDLIGRHYTRHGLPIPGVMAVTFISYAFNLNLGSLVGGVAMRLRLYSRRGLAPGVIAQVIALSMLTNWLGYCVLGGVVFLAAPPALPGDWALGTTGLRIVGVALLAAAATYLALCLHARRREFTVRGHLLVLPPARLAATQVALSCANWSLMALLLVTLLPVRLPFAEVLATLLVAALAGVITHVPAGLGVLEAVFVALLSHRVPVPSLLAALLAYRAVYYLGPWALAAATYAWLERLRSGGFSARPRPPPTP